MCQTHIVTTRYAKCRPPCRTVRRILVLGLCVAYAATQQACQNPEDVHLGQRTARGQCPDHKDEGFAEHDTR
jgi:hypothetical protein